MTPPPPLNAADAPPPPAAAAPPETTATGLPPRVAACLSYAAWWVSGAIVLAVEPRHPFVRFHARQALVGFGAIWLLGVALWGSSFLLAFVSTRAFTVTSVLANAVWVAGAVLWVICLVVAARGGEWALPWVRRAPGAAASATD